MANTSPHASRQLVWILRVCVWRQCFWVFEKEGEVFETAGVTSVGEGNVKAPLAVFCWASHSSCLHACLLACLRLYEKRRHALTSLTLYARNFATSCAG